MACNTFVPMPNPQQRKQTKFCVAGAVKKKTSKQINVENSTYFCMDYIPKTKSTPTWLHGAEAPASILRRRKGIRKKRFAPHAARRHFRSRVQSCARREVHVEKKFENVGHAT